MTNDDIERVLAKLSNGDPGIWPQIWLAKDYSKADLVRDLASLVNAAPPEACKHEWIDATNEVIQSGEVCLKCNAVRAAEASE